MNIYIVFYLLVKLCDGRGGLVVIGVIISRKVKQMEIKAFIKILNKKY